MCAHGTLQTPKRLRLPQNPQPACGSVTRAYENRQHCQVFSAFANSRLDCAGDSRIGADAPEILSTLGYGSDEITRMTESGAIGRTEWAKA